MKKSHELISENFNDLLNWFSENQEEAGERYEEIRKGLIRFFYLKGCADPEDLADETFNRVASKFSVLDLSEKTKFLSVFYGFASKICLEYLKSPKNMEIEFNAHFHAPAVTEDSAAESADKKHDCFKKCLANLQVEESDLIVEYYNCGQGAKNKHRKELAEKFNISLGALQIKAFRLRKILRKCIEKCAAEK